MRRLLRDSGWLADAFAVSNLGFLGVDILLAHSENSFARAVEWLPVAMAPILAVALAPMLVPTYRERWRAVAFAVGGLSIVLGVAGMVYHLESAFFLTRTLRELVYSAPFLAPLSFVGVGLLVVVSRMEVPGTAMWGWWVGFLAWGGFLGNLGLSLLDHAQNGFFRPSEWIAVVGAAFACAFLLIALLRPGERAFLGACYGILAVQVAVGLLGFLLHLSADLKRPGASLAHRVIHGAPVFAPLLFADLAALAAVGLAAIRRAPGAGSGP